MLAGKYKASKYLGYAATAVSVYSMLGSGAGDASTTQSASRDPVETTEDGLERFPLLKEEPVKKGLADARDWTANNGNREAGGIILQNRITGRISARLAFSSLKSTGTSTDIDCMLGFVEIFTHKIVGGFHSHPDMGRFLSGGIGDDIKTFTHCGFCGSVHFVVDRYYVYGMDRTGLPAARIGSTPVILGR